MRNLRRKLFSQNFLHDHKLAHTLVGRSSIGKNDLVLEIGPGRGILTRELVQKADQVIAVEIDKYWCEYLHQNFKAKNLRLYHTDFLSFDTPKLPYKVFANIPFAIEGKIIRKLIGDENPPQDCYLVIMCKLAERLYANNQENMFSIMHKPWFDFSIEHYFSPTDFRPVPQVNAVLFRFKKKAQPLLSMKVRKEYRQFVQRGFGNGLAVRQNLKKYYSLQAIDRSLQKLGASKKAKPTHLNAVQWIKLFLFLQSH